MSKKVERISPHEKELTLAALREAAKRMDKHNSAIGFIETLLTESEKITIGRRILVAHMLLRGETQREIGNQLDVSPNTVSTTRRWLEDQMPNYGTALKQITAEAENRRHTREDKRRKKTYEMHPDPLSFAGMRKRYPGHFLLFTIADELFKKLNEAKQSH